VAALSDPAALITQEVRRNRVVGLAFIIAASLVAIAILFLLGIRGTAWGVLAFVILGAVGPVTSVSGWVLLHREWLPGIRVVIWANRHAEQAWKRLTEVPVPSSPDEALAILGDRRDDGAMALRIAWLAAASRTDDLRAALRDWRPADDIGRARHARHSSTLALLEGKVDDLQDAWSAASAISDPVGRVKEQARVFVEDARRLADAERNPFPRLVEAARVLGPRLTEFETVEDIRVRDDVKRRVLIRLAVSAAGTIALSFVAGLAFFQVAA
jgi:hypothetical protein